MPRLDPALPTIAPLLILLLASACVETADCDRNISCRDSVGCTDCLCFRKFCKPTCDTTADCAEGELCVPCEGNCFGATGNVCVVEDVCEPICKEGEEVCCRGACVLVSQCILQ